MRDDFFKFPSTPHLTIIDSVDVRSDKVLSGSESDEFLRHDLVVEEKVDGANLGISFDTKGNVRAQNRGAYLHIPSSGQWKKLGEWLTPRTEVLLENLMDRYVLFGEWCYAQHSVFYDQLMDWFLGFDIYDKQTGYFLSSDRRNKFFQKAQIIPVPTIARGRFTLTELKKLLSHSKLSDQPAEGLYLRLDKGSWLAQRAKLVRPAFIQSAEQHWSHSVIRPNCLSPNIHAAWSYPPNGYFQ